MQYTRHKLVSLSWLNDKPYDLGTKHLGYINSFDFDCEQITWTTDGANAGTVFIREGKHNCTNVCGTLRLYSSNHSLKFFTYYLQFAAQFYKRPDTNGAKIMNNEMAEIIVTDIPISEQTLIAHFLDRETAKIDDLIAEQEKLITLLDEKRQAMISHAVTKGLDPDAPMKDSGVEWLGEVPEEWQLIEIKRIGTIKYGIGEPPSYQEEGVPLVRATNVDSGKITKKGLVFVDPNDIPEKRIVWLQDKDIIVVRSGAYTGDSAIVTTEYINAIAGFDMVLTIKNNDAKFIQYCLLSNYLKKAQLDLKKLRAAQPHLNAEELGESWVVLPSLSEQTGIVTYLDKKTVQLDALRTEAQRGIDLLKERRSALISAAVTGKVDVRGLVNNTEAA